MDLEKKMLTNVGIKLQGLFYTALEAEKNTKKCHTNFITRMTLLSDNFDELNKEWNTLTSYHENGLCICGRVIKHTYMLRNKNKNMVLVGSSCIDKFKSPELKKALNNLSREYCKTCDCSVQKILIHNKTKKHILGLNSRKCLDCSTRILNKDAKWKTRCLECHIKSEKSRYLLPQCYDDFESLESVN